MVVHQGIQFQYIPIKSPFVDASTVKPVKPVKAMQSHLNTMNRPAMAGWSQFPLQACNDAQQRRGGKGGTGAAGAQEARCRSFLGWTKTEGSEGLSLP